MSLPRLDYATRIADRLNELAATVKTRSRASLTDANRFLETIAGRFFNALFGWDLVNLNIGQANYPAADLGDRGRRIAVQVTNEEGPDKIRHTTTKADEHHLGNEFDRLIVFFLLPRKPGFPRNFTQPPGGPKIETWDITDLLMQLPEVVTLDTLARATAVLDEEMAKIAGTGTRRKFDISRILKYAPAELIGREKELKLLNDAWVKVCGGETKRPRILTLVALGGEGKTSLVAKWAAELAHQDWPGCDAAFAWSFYSQGMREHGGMSADTFIAAALEFFGDEDGRQWARSPASPWDKGSRLAEFIARRRGLLVLDGLEPLQHPPSSPLAGQIRDPALAAVLKCLAVHNPGLCVVTTREPVADLAPFRHTTAPELILEQLSVPAGVALLKQLGVRAESGSKQEFEQLVIDVKGHALTINLLGRFLAKAHRGDIRLRSRVKLKKADAKVQGGHAFKVIAAYERWLTDGGPRGACQLAVLRLLGLFDRPADAGSLAALQRAPAIEGLTEVLVDIDEEDWNLAISALAECGLVSCTQSLFQTAYLKASGSVRLLLKALRDSGLNTSPQSGQSSQKTLAPTPSYQPENVMGFHDQPKHEDRLDAEGVSYETSIRPCFDICVPSEVALLHPPLDDFKARETGPCLEAHPIIREYFATQLRETNPNAWKEAHQRIYEYLKEATVYRPDTLEGIQRLYDAVAHGCSAGLHQDVCDGVYWNRILRNNEYYSTNEHGAFGADLTAVGCFFDRQWTEPCSSLSRKAQACLLNQAGIQLRALGLVADALTPLRHALERNLSDRNWLIAAQCACNLGETLLLFGDIPVAVKQGEVAVALADRSQHALWSIALRTALADALHQAGRASEAAERFSETEAMLIQTRPETPQLYSLLGFRYCDLLLNGAERDAWKLSLAAGLDLDTSDSLNICRAVTERAQRTLGWVNEWLKDILSSALDHLTLGQTEICRSILTRSVVCSSNLPLEVAHQHFAAAMNGIQRGGLRFMLPDVLLSRSWLRFLTSANTGPESAQADLDEAWEIAERGPMRLHMADIHLHRARLFFREKTYPWESPAADLAAAEKLINDCGYHRRDEELADAKRAILGT